MSRWSWQLVLMGVVVCLCNGCGGAAQEDPGVEVTGTLTKGGAGQEGVTVGFVASNKGVSKAATTDSAGKFKLKLLPGRYAVILSKKVDASGNVPPPDADLGQLEADGQLRETMPAQYTDPDSTLLGTEVPQQGGELPPLVIEG
jgi:hypothetical protein